MNQFKEAGKTIIFVSHDKNAVESFCSRAAWINKGELITYGDSKLIGSYYNDFMSGKKTLEEILAEIQFNHSIEEFQYGYSETGLTININGYLYGNRNLTDKQFKLIVRDLRTNQVFSKPIERVPYTKDPLLPDDVQKNAGFVINITEDEFQSLYKPGKYSFEIGYKNEKNEQCTFSLWAGNVKIINQNNEESDILGRYKHTFKIENNNLYLFIDNHEKVQEQVNKIWFENNKLNIEYVAFVRGYETHNADDVESNFYLINLKTFEEFTIPTIVSETEEITENPMFNPQGKNYNHSKFKLSIDLNELPKGKYECKVSYHMKKSPYYSMLALVWATNTTNYPTETYKYQDKNIDIKIISKYLYIEVS